MQEDTLAWHFFLEDHHGTKTRSSDEEKRGPGDSGVKRRLGLATGASRDIPTQDKAGRQ